MPVTGDFARLARLIQELGTLGGPTVIARAAFGAQAALVTEVQLSFREERTPYGEKWAGLKKDRARNKKASKVNGKSAKGKILRDTGRLANSITGTVDGASARVGTNVVYGRYHQEGTARMVARPFLFTASRGLSADAAAEVGDVIVRELRRSAPSLLGAAE